MGNLRAVCKQVERIGWVHVHSLKEVAGFVPGRVIALDLHDYCEGGRFSSTSTNLTRAEALELGRTLVMAASVFLEGEF